MGIWYNLIDVKAQSLKNIQWGKNVNKIILIEEKANSIL